MAEENPEVLDLIWGAEAIGQVIGKSRSATFWMIKKGRIPAIKRNSQWVVSRKKLREVFEGEAA